LKKLIKEYKTIYWSTDDIYLSDTILAKTSHSRQRRWQKTSTVSSQSTFTATGGHPGCVFFRVQISYDLTQGCRRKSRTLQDSTKLLPIYT